MRCSNCGTSAGTAKKMLSTYAKKMWEKHGVYLCRKCRIELSYEFFIQTKKQK